ncbi:MAG: MaoC family dehydratase N-terminal domain-containing protein [SAR324 cluster bacterium]|jgi:hypothetical protein|nr:MaoC family dehydratase N-terminal domain-containing protein [SAR324 cluster bacterium]
MIDKNLIGYSFEPVQLAVEAGRLKFVAKALGLTDPVYSDADAACAEGYSDLLAPPTFPFMLESDALDLEALCEFFGQNVKHLLHAEQKFTYHQLICAGDQITFVKTIREIFDKKNEQLEFVVSDNTLTNQNDILCVESQTTYVFRNA